MHTVLAEAVRNAGAAANAAADHLLRRLPRLRPPPPRAPQALSRLLHHFHSILWMTYRTSFTPIAVGEVQLRSDAGWGCTLRR